MVKIYGVDTTKKVTPIMVRDALVKCFKDAHKEALDDTKDIMKFESKKELEDMKNLQVKMIIVTKMKELGGDFENPTKEILEKTCDTLADFAKKFRKPEIIKKHHKQIMTLVKLLD